MGHLRENWLINAKLGDNGYGYQGCGMTRREHLFFQSRRKKLSPDSLSAENPGHRMRQPPPS
jgi:hypothetical protein